MDQIKNNVVESLKEISAEMLENLVGQRTVVRCNYSDSRSGNTNYAAWTETHLYKITEPNGEVFWYSMGYYTGGGWAGGYRRPETVEAPEEIYGAEELNWSKAPETLKRHHYDVLFPGNYFKGNNTLEYRIFSLGLEKGQEAYKRDLFLDERPLGWVGSLKLAEEIYDRFGPWESYQYEEIYDDRYLIVVDNGVTAIHQHYYDGDRNTFFLGTHEEFLEKYQEMTLRAEKARVPLSIALLTEKIENEKQALKVLEELAYVKLNFQARRFKNVRFFDEDEENFYEKQLQEYKKLLGFRLFKKVNLENSLEVFKNYLYK